MRNWGLELLKSLSSRSWLDLRKALNTDVGLWNQCLRQPLPMTFCSEPSLEMGHVCCVPTMCNVQGVLKVSHMQKVNSILFLPPGQGLWPSWLGPKGKAPQGDWESQLWFPRNRVEGLGFGPDTLICRCSVPPPPLYLTPGSHSSFTLSEPQFSHQRNKQIHEELWFSLKRDFVPRDIQWCHHHEVGATGPWWAEARGAAQHPTTHRTTPDSPSAVPRWEALA